MLGASSCSTKQLFTGSGAPKITFAGDSITFQATSDIDAHYGPSYDVAIHATIGYDTNISASAIHQDATVDVPSIEIINLGTNDATRAEIDIPRDLQPFPDVVLSTPGIWRELPHGEPPGAPGWLRIECRANGGGWYIKHTRLDGGGSETGPVRRVYRSATTGHIEVGLWPCTVYECVGTG